MSVRGMDNPSEPETIDVALFSHLPRKSPMMET